LHSSNEEKKDRFQPQKIQKNTRSLFTPAKKEKPKQKHKIRTRSEFQESTVLGLKKTFSNLLKNQTAPDRLQIQN
jgi:hypothetical protein